MTLSWKQNLSMTHLDRNNAHSLVHVDARCFTLDFQQHDIERLRDVMGQMKSDIRSKKILIRRLLDTQSVF